MSLSSLKCTKITNTVSLRKIAFTYQVERNIEALKNKYIQGRKVKPESKGRVKKKKVSSEIWEEDKLH